MAKDKKKAKSAPLIGPELEHVFDGEVHQNYRASYRPVQSSNSPGSTSPFKPAPRIFNEKIDRIDRESQLTQAVRERSGSIPGLSAYVNRDVPDVSRLLVEPDSVDQGVINPELVEGVTPEAIDELNNPAELLQQKLDAAGADKYEGVDAATRGLMVENDYLDAAEDERRIVEEPPLASLMGQTDRHTFVISEYPTLALGLAQGDFTEDEVRDTVNFTVAFDAVTKLNAPGMTVEQQRAMLSFMSPAQQLLVRDIWAAGIEEIRAEQAAEDYKPPMDAQAVVDEARAEAYQQFSFEEQADAGEVPFELGIPGYIAETVADRVVRSTEVIPEQDTGNTATQALKQVWNWTGGLAFQVLFDDLNEGLQRGYRFGSLAADKLGGDQYNAVFGEDLGFADYDTSWSEVWNMATTGGMDQQMVAEAKERYGPRKVDIAVRIMAGQQDGETDTLPEIITELSPLALAGDQEAAELLEWIGATQHGDSPDQEEAMQVFDELQLARTGYTGNIFFSQVNGPVPADADERLKEGQSTQYQVLSTTGQIYGYMLDPFWFAGAARTGLMASRYGLWRIVGENGVKSGDDFAMAFSKPAVQRAFTQLGDDLKSLDDAPDLGVAGQKRKSVEAQWKRYFTPEALDELRAYMRTVDEDVAYTPKAFEDFFQQNENVIHLINGQSARRSKQLVIPHMTSATVAWKKSAMKARGLTYDKGNAYEYLNELIGPEWTSKMPDDAMEALASALEKAKTEEELAMILSDFKWVDGEMERTFLGVLSSKVPKTRQDKWGWKTDGGPLSRRGLERKRKWGQRLPMDDRPLTTVDGRDAKRVGDLLEWSGMPRYFARMIEEMWSNPNTTQAAREAVGPSLVRMVAKAKGIDPEDAKAAGVVWDRVSGATRGDVYSPYTTNMTALAPRVRAFAEGEVTARAAQERAARFADWGRDTYQVGDEVWFWKPSRNGNGSWIQGTVTKVNQKTIKVKGAGAKGLKPERLMPKRAGQVQAAPTPEAARLIAAKLKFPRGDSVVDETGRYYLTRSNDSEWTVTLLDDEGDLLESLSVHNTRAKAIKEAQEHADEAAAAVEPAPVQSATDFAKPDAPLTDTNRTREHMNEARQQETPTSASEFLPGQHAAVVSADMTDHLFFPNVAALDEVSKRASTVSALLGNNSFVSTLTDYWTLGTLAGPRFQIRSGIEDGGMYVLTGGSLGNVVTGRRMSQALLKGQRRTKDTGKRQRAKRVVDENGKVIRYESLEGDRPLKLGIVATTYTNTVNRGADLVKKMSRALFDTDYDSRIDTINQILVTHATPQELAYANDLAEAGNRAALAALVGQLYMRQRFVGHPTHGWIAELGGKDMAKLTDDQLRDLQFLNDAVYYNDSLRVNDSVSELSSHLFDGRPIASGMDIEIGTRRWNPKTKEWEVVVRQDNDFQSVPMVFNGAVADEVSVNAFWNAIAKSMPLSDGPKAQAALVRLVSYVDAMAAGDTAKVNEIIAEVAEVIRDYGFDGKWNYMTKSRIAREAEAEGLASATLENLRTLLTTRNGDMNWAVYNKLKLKVKRGTDEYTSWGVQHLDGNGELVYTLRTSDLVSLKSSQFPEQVVVNRGGEVTKSVKPTFSQQMWGGMGRSLARVTRSPIFMGNYLENRRLIAGLQKQREEQLLQKYGGADNAEAVERSIDEAARWADGVAAQRAYETTMAYVDNPAIRSNLAWEVRNVARFYRALEDFGRRMMRTSRNQPAALLKLAASWRVIDNSGWFWEDEYGDKYFIWPGTQVAFSAMHKFMQLVGADMYSGDLPMAYSSRVTGLSPSADPNALLPTFSGMYAYIAVLPAVRWLGDWTGLDAEQELFGEYTNKDLNPFYAAVPPHLSRFLSIVGGPKGDPENKLDSTRNDSPFSAQYVNAAFSAVQAAGAAGWWDESELMTDQKRRELERRVDRVAQWMVPMKAIGSLFFPAALSNEVLQSSELARNLGYTDLRGEFIALMKETETMDDAVVAWMQMYPDGRSPFIATVSKSASGDNGFWTPFKETADFVNENQDLVESNPRGLSFYQPGKGETTLRAFEVLKVNDLTEQGSPLAYMDRMLTAHTDAVVEANKKLFELDRFENGTSTTVWTDTLKALRYDGFPNAGAGQFTAQGQGARPFYGTPDYATTDVALMKSAGEELAERGTLDARGRKILELIEVNEEIYRSRYHEGIGQGLTTTEDRQYADYLRDTWDATVLEVLREYPEDRVMLAALRTMTEHIGFGFKDELVTGVQDG
jgi:hypothetical protein